MQDLPVQMKSRSRNSRFGRPPPSRGSVQFTASNESEYEEQEMGKPKTWFAHNKEEPPLIFKVELNLLWWLVMGVGLISRFLWIHFPNNVMWVWTIDCTSEAARGLSVCSGYLVLINFANLIKWTQSRAVETPQGCILPAGTTPLSFSHSYVVVIIITIFTTCLSLSLCVDLLVAMTTVSTYPLNFFLSRRLLLQTIFSRGKAH